jgi:arylsulfatase
MQNTGGMAASFSELAYPLLFNIEMDPSEQLGNLTMYWAEGPALKAVEEYKESLKKYPNPPGANLTRF